MYKRFSGKKSQWGLTLVSAILTSLASACVSGPQTPPEVLVVERSELGRPRWVDEALEVEPAAEKWFVYSKKGLLKLDLGIRQTQASGVAEHCKLLSERMRFEIGEILEEQSRTKPAGKDSAPIAVGETAGRQQAIDKALAELAAANDCPELEPKDIYWEAVRRLTPDGPRISYDVYVLLRIKQIHFDEVLAMTVNSLKLSGRADLEPVAEVLRSRMSDSLKRGTNE